mmetsp:Transcript_36092/g.52867  ORF Transcript_36092/g.52867 Transcript_36092/m.52867 type:complete len:201 (-) Transcript_36092:158-760(-)
MINLFIILAIMTQATSAFVTPAKWQHQNSPITNRHKQLSIQSSPSATQIISRSPKKSMMKHNALPPSFQLAEQQHMMLSSSSSLLSLDSMNDVSEAFTDEVNITEDPIIQLMLGGFALISIVLITLTLLSSKMDDAIEFVLEDFESTMKTYYKKRWVLIEEQLEDCKDEAERTEKLISIMEDMQRNEPALMERINRDMAK